MFSLTIDPHSILHAGPQSVGPWARMIFAHSLISYSLENKNFLCCWISVIYPASPRSTHDQTPPLSDCWAHKHESAPICGRQITTIASFQMEYEPWNNLNAFLSTSLEKMYWYTKHDIHTGVINCHQLINKTRQFNCCAWIVNTLFCFFGLDKIIKTERYAPTLDLSKERVQRLKQMVFPHGYSPESSCHT